MKRDLAGRAYPDLHEHLDELRRRGLLVEIARPIDKDSELHPLVRWQFVGGMDEAARKAFSRVTVTTDRGSVVAAATHILKLVD